MTETDTPLPYPWMRKLVIPGLIGGAASGAASYAMLRYIDSAAVGGLGLSATLAALVGVLYCVISVGVMAGTANPRFGAWLSMVIYHEMDELMLATKREGGATSYALVFIARGRRGMLTTS
jgi:hypothetical protein